MCKLVAWAFSSVLLGLCVGQALAVELNESKRYYEASGKPVFFIGHYDWASVDPASFIDHPSTYKQMIDDAKANNLNYLRVSLSINRFTKNSNPPIYGGSGATPTAFRYVNGKVDLDQWDPDFWAGLEAIAIYARENGVILHVAIFDGVTLRAGLQAYRWGNSQWNIDNHGRNFFGDIDTNGNGSADQDYEFYKPSAFDSSSYSGSNPEKLSYYQKRLIDKAISTLNQYDNVLFEVGNETLGASSDWLSQVIRYAKTKTDKLITVNPRNWGDVPANAAGFSDHVGASYPLQVKRSLPDFVGNGMPAWIDPDGASLMRGSPAGNRLAAWYSFAGGAAGWGGFTTHYWDNDNKGNAATLRYYRHLADFIEQSGIHFWLMEPDHSLTNNSEENSVLSNPGKEYLVYVGNDSSVIINLQEGEYNYFTFDPQTGNSSEIGTISGGQPVKLSRPGFASYDWAIYVLNPAAFDDGGKQPLPDIPVDADPNGDDGDNGLPDGETSDTDTLVNLALGKYAYASSEESDQLNEQLAIDGDMSTRWSSAFSDTQWLYVDLGQAETLGRVVIHWERAAAKQYRILVSNDRKNWVPVAVETQGARGEMAHTFEPIKARYIGVLGEERGTGWGYSLWEFEAYSK